MASRTALDGRGIVMNDGGKGDALLEATQEVLQACERARLRPVSCRNGRFRVKVCVATPPVYHNVRIMKIWLKPTVAGEADRAKVQ